MIRKRIIASAVMAIGLTLGIAAPADARITPVDIACQNPAGNYPGGQQPSCKGGGHTQESENQNPAGHAPPGHNK